MTLPSRSGFTLVEVIVSLTVASLALTAGFATLAFVQDRTDAAEAASRVAIAGAAQRATLIEWLESARADAPTGEDFNGAEDEDPGVEKDLLLMPTTARTPLGHGTSVVGLYIDEDPETPERGLVAELTGSTLGAEPRRMELAPEAVSMRIRYLPDAEDAVDWVDTWSSGTLPRGVEITLGAAPGDSLPFMLRHPIRVAFGAVQ